MYVPIAHWSFSPHGWLTKLGLLDFAGGTVVEINAGASALALVLVLGKRRGWPAEPMAPHSLPLTLLGAGILWFGWFGFNAGSALASGTLAAQALIGTHLAGLRRPAGLDRAREEGDRARHHPRRGVRRGVRPGRHHTGRRLRQQPRRDRRSASSPASPVCYAVRLKFRHGYDDSLDVVGVHGVCGVVGTLAVGSWRRGRSTRSGAG